VKGRSGVLLKVVFRNVSGEAKQQHRVCQCRWYRNQNLNSRSPEYSDAILHNVFKLKNGLLQHKYLHITSTTYCMTQQTKLIL
jgi:hypothetical protein